MPAAHARRILSVALLAAFSDGHQADAEREAIRQVARRYYAGGRVMSTALLQETFQNLLAPAKQMQAQYLPQIQATAQTLDAGKVLTMVRGG